MNKSQITLTLLQQFGSSVGECGHDTQQVLGSIPSRAAFCIITVAHFNYIRLKGKDIFYLLYIIRSFLDLKLQFINSSNTDLYITIRLRQW